MKTWLLGLIVIGCANSRKEADLLKSADLFNRSFAFYVLSKSAEEPSLPVQDSDSSEYHLFKSGTLLFMAEKLHCRHAAKTGNQQSCGHVGSGKIFSELRSKVREAGLRSLACVQLARISRRNNKFNNEYDLLREAFPKVEGGRLNLRYQEVSDSLDRSTE